MFRRSRPALPSPLPTVLHAALSAALWIGLPLAATAAGDKGASAPAAKASEAPPVVEASDPMSRLKLRLEAKLGAAKAPDAVGTHELRIASPAPAAARPAAGKPSMSKEDARLRALVAAHRGGDAPGVKSTSGALWGYEGSGGPANWATLKPEFELCGSGTRQSPIDIRDGIAVDLPPVSFDYRAGGFSVIDNGYTVQVSVAPGNSIEVTGQRYELQHLRFHRPSEERVNGRQFDMSAHLVHKGPDGRLAVVAVLLERGAAQPVIQQVWNNLPLEKGVSVPAASAIDPADLLPKDRRYYTYMGSLTTPPCSEGVLWMVMQQPVPVSLQQVNIFSRLYPMNARPVQQAAGRLIKQSN